MYLWKEKSSQLFSSWVESFNLNGLVFKRRKTSFVFKMKSNDSYQCTNANVFIVEGTYSLSLCSICILERCVWGLWELHPRNLHPHKWWQAHASAVVIFDICLWQTVKFKLQAKKFYFLYYLSYQREINNRTGSNRYPDRLYVYSYPEVSGEYNIIKP